MQVHTIHEDYHAAAKDELSYLADIQDQKESLKDKIKDAECNRKKLIPIRDTHEDFVGRIKEAVESINGLWDRCVDDKFCAQSFSEVPGG